jgi:hypothetical protein
MKKVVLSIVATAVVFVACEKRNPAVSNPASSSASNVDSETSTSSANAKQSAWGICCVWNGVDACVSPAVNCFDEVVVTPKFSALKTAKDNLDIAAASRSSAQVAAYFQSKDATVLFPDLSSAANKSYLADLQSGNYFLVQVDGQGRRSHYLAIQNGSAKESFVLVVKETGEKN